MSELSERDRELAEGWLSRAQDYANTGRKRREEIRDEMVGVLAAVRAEGVAQGRREAIEFLREVRDKGLIYWEPQTSQGYISKQMMFKRIENFLALAEPPVAEEEL